MFEDLRDLYQDVILRHGRTPTHGRRLTVFDAEAKGDNPMCGDRVTVFLRHEAGHIAELGFEARGCAISIASADLMAEAVTGLTPPEALTLGDSFAHLARTGTSDAAGLDLLRPLAGVFAYPSRVKCATLPWAALRAALSDQGVASSE